ncbi:MAG: c-type cytochrome [Anaerolineaceae bacterium]|nr:c-type cytochrome [Anaerolineaceae bacterium]
MRQIFKWMAIGLGSLVIIAGIAALVLYSLGRSRLNRTHEITAAAISVDDNAETVERGKHLVEAVVACGECHGEGLHGRAFFDEPAIGTVVSANLTGGEGGLAGAYRDEDWIRAIRHGVDPSGKPLLVMPAQHFQNMSAADLGAVIAYLKTVPPVDNVPPATKLTPLTYILIALGQFDNNIPADTINHSAPLPEAPPEGATQAYGEYLVSIATCRECHGKELTSGQAGPGQPIGPNLTPSGNLGSWSQADFFRLIRTGQTPTGRQINDFMPWHYYRQMTDVELEAIWLYLQSLEPAATPVNLSASE